MLLSCPMTGKTSIVRILSEVDWLKKLQEENRNTLGHYSTLTPHYLGRLQAIKDEEQGINRAAMDPFYKAPPKGQTPQEPTERKREILKHLNASVSSVSQVMSEINTRLEANNSNLAMQVGLSISEKMVSEGMTKEEPMRLLLGLFSLLDKAIYMQTSLGEVLQSENEAEDKVTLKNEIDEIAKQVSKQVELTKEAFLKIWDQLGFTEQKLFKEKYEKFGGIGKAFLGVDTGMSYKEEILKILSVK